MKNFMLCVLLAFAGCAMNYVAPVAIDEKFVGDYGVGIDEFVTGAERVLVLEGYDIAYSKSGIIKTKAKVTKLTVNDATCGSSPFGDYLKDKRVDNTVSLIVSAGAGRFVVNSVVTGEYKVGSVSQDLTLTCYSKGGLENKIGALLSAM